MTSYGVTNTDPSSENNGQTTAVSSAPANPNADEAVSALVAEDAGSARERAADSEDAASKQRAEDEQFRRENPNKPLVRAANPEVGGESF